MEECMFEELNLESIKSVKLVLSSVFSGPEVYFAGKDNEERLIGIYYDKDWKEFCTNFFDIVKDWKKESYVDPYTLDGTQWSLVVLKTDMTEIRIGGSNKFPKYFGKLKKLMMPYRKYRDYGDLSL
jgi:hypothetical protein